MAPGLMRKTMAYLGLVEDEYDSDYYEPQPPQASRGISRRAVAEDEEEQLPSSSGGSIRTLTRDEPAPAAQPSMARPAVVRPLPADAAAKVHVVAPVQFVDAQQIADRLMANQPVIINLQVADSELGRRMIDFCSGVTYALNGKMERVADRVFLVTPSNVRVSAEERERLQQNGLMRS